MGADSGECRGCQKGMKAQISSEFLVVFSMLLMVFLVMYTIFFGSNIDLNQSQNALRAERDAMALAAAINFVYLAGEGAGYNLSMGALPQGEIITVSGTGVSCEIGKAFGSAPLLTGATSPSGNMSGNVNITNRGGEVYAHN